MLNCIRNSNMFQHQVAYLKHGENQANLQKARGVVQRLVRPCLLKDAPLPSYQEKEIEFNQPPPSKPKMDIQHTHSNLRPEQYSNNHQPNTYRAENILKKTQMENSLPEYPRQESVWNINMMVDTHYSQPKSSPRRKSSSQRQPVTFKPANKLASGKCKAGVAAEWQNRPEVPDAELYRLLKLKFKLEEFRNNQKAIIKCTMLGKDAFVCMPTGGGKSLTFQVPLLLEPGLTFCILPLVSLIFDQEMQAQSMGLRAFGLTGQTDYEVMREVYSAIRTCEESKEEKLTRSQKLVEILKQQYDRNLFKRIVIDEVHCVSTWGRDFRKDYQNLGILKKVFPTVPILALTATASDEIRDDIIDKLLIRGCYFFRSSFNRPNLSYQVLPKKPASILSDMMTVINQHQNQSGLIYCISRKDTQEIADKLINKGVKAHHYHGEMVETLKKKVQEDWMQDRINIVVATIAFGMGINKPNVRFVIHYSLSKSLENYYQQSGRAGRDGKPSQCILYYRNSDANGHKYLINNSSTSNDQTKNYCTTKLNQMIAYCEDTSTCRRKLQLNYFGEEFDPELCEKTCDNCMNFDGVEVKGTECYQEAEVLLTFLIQLAKKKENLTQSQLVAFIQGKTNQLQNKMKFFDKKSINRDQLTIFQGWKDPQIKKFIQELISKGYAHEQVFKINTFSTLYVTSSPSRFYKLQSQGTFVFKFINQKKQPRKNRYEKSHPHVSEPADNWDNQSANFDSYNYKRVSEETKPEEAGNQYDQIMLLLGLENNGSVQFSGSGVNSEEEEAFDYSSFE